MTQSRKIEGEHQKGWKITIQGMGPERVSEFARVLHKGPPQGVDAGQGHAHAEDHQLGGVHLD